MVVFKRIRMIWIIILAIAAAGVLAVFSHNFIKHLNENEISHVRYFFGGYYEDPAENFSIIHFTLLFLPFMLVSSLSTVYLDTFIHEICYISAYRFRNLRQYTLFHAFALTVLCTSFMTVFLLAMVVMGRAIYAENAAFEWNTLLVQWIKLSSLTGTLSFVQLYLSAIFSTQISALCGTMGYGILLLSDFSIHSHYKFVLIDGGITSMCFGILAYLVGLTFMILFPQRHMMRVLFP